MNSAITKCPKCDTSFRITEAHLKSAKGAVRCGSCLNVFNARDYLIAEDKPKPPTQKAPVHVENSASALLQSRGIDADEMISDDESFGDKVTLDFSDGLADEDDFVYEEKEVEKASNLFERTEKAKTDDDEDNTDFDESWADALLSDDPEDESEADEVQHEKNEPEDFSARSWKARKDIEKKSANNPFTSKDIEKPGSSVNKTAFGPGVFQLVDEDPDPSGSLIANRKSGSEKPKPKGEKKTNADKFDGDIEEVSYDNYGLGYDDDIVDDVLESKRYARNIEPEPVEFSYSENHWLWNNKKVMFGLVAIALLCAVIQYAWIRFDDLSKVEPWRGMYGHACDILGCELPVLIDRSKINASNLVVRSHPETPNVLVVDTVLQNKASFAQSFPHLDLIFLDAKSAPIAARRLAPEDYLGGELAGAKEMPSRQPIRVGVEIMDPGAEAVSYTISIAK